MNKRSSISLACLLSASLLAGAAFADDDTRTYEVTVTNLTRGVSFTPILAATHIDGVRLYQLGQPASSALAVLAEGGETTPLATVLAATPHAHTATTTGQLAPGKTVKLTLTAHEHASRISLAAMMIPTNDAFIAVNNMPLPKGKETITFLSNGHDAGSEPNDELCINIPGPTCGGEGVSPHASGEGFVHIHAGIHGIGTLKAAEYDWRNPVARITVRRVAQ